MALATNLVACTEDETEEPKPTPAVITAATYNAGLAVGYVEASEARAPETIRYIDSLDADILCVQEGDPVIRQRIAQAWMGLRIQRYNALRTLSQSYGAELSREAMITKIYWANWHRSLGKLAMDVLGPQAEIVSGAPYQLSSLQRMYLFTRSDTIYGGSNEIQRNIIAERALGLPREPR